MKFPECPVFSVSQINEYIKGRMEEDEVLENLLIRGEISNYKKYPSGHHYFSLKDDRGSLRCVLFRGDAGKLRFQPANGMQVVACGRISVFPRDGQYQLYCRELFADGQGNLSLAFEQLKEKLGKEGLFDQDHKQKIPEFPGKIALITSPAGAAVRDMIRILGARWPMTSVMVVPVRVQGEEAPGEIASAIWAVNNRADIDLIITGRGGGSAEDLWAFNEEIVARAIYYSNIPVISAVGHEPDVTISDYVADLRAATPSNAAELAVPDRAELRQTLDHLISRLAGAEKAVLSARRLSLQRLQSARVLQNMKAPIEDRRMLLDYQQKRMTMAGNARISSERTRLVRYCAGLDAMSPMKVLIRGYAVVREENRVIRSVTQIREGDTLSVQMQDGRFSCVVKEKEQE